MATLDSNLPHDSLDEYETEPLPLPSRRRLPRLTVALVVAVVGAGAFIGGLEAQKHWGSSSGSGSGASGGAASALAARLGRAGTGAGAAGSQRGFGGGGATVGTVDVIKGSTLYVTDAGGNTVKVLTSAASAVSKTVSTTVKAIHPGDTVVVRGTAGKAGAISAESITLGGAGGFGGFGARGGGGGGASGFGGGGDGAPSGFGGGS